MALGDLQAGAGIEQADVAALADHDRFGECEDAGERDVEIGQDAHGGRLDHELPKPMEIAGARAARIDQGGGARAARDRLRAHAERGAAPIHMRVQVDQSGHHQRAGGSDGLAGERRVDVRGDLGDLAARECDVVAAVQPLRRIDHAPAGDDQIVHAVSPAEVRFALRAAVKHLDLAN